MTRARNDQATRQGSSEGPDGGGREDSTVWTPCPLSGGTDGCRMIPRRATDVRKHTRTRVRRLVHTYIRARQKWYRVQSAGKLGGEVGRETEKSGGGGGNREEDGNNGD